jgi:hypothetical protein
MKKLDEIVNMLAFAVKGRRFVKLSDAWNYGWCLEEYRRSPQAAIQVSRTRAARLTPEGVRAFAEV